MHDIALPGRPLPLGATYDGAGTNVAVVAARATGVQVCLFDDAGRERVVELRECTAGTWHGYLPGVGPGQRYGLRVDGPFEPGHGLRCNPAKLLLDPYARAVDGELRLADAIFGSVPGNDRVRQSDDSAPYVPRSVVVADSFDWADDRPPGTHWADTVLYELHVKGFTARHPDVPQRLRGTYAGLAHPAAVEHLLALGVTAVELMPVHQYVTEPALLRRGAVNHWGYNTLGFFAPHAGYSSAGLAGQQVGEFKAMVRTLHAAGLEVVLDVVYNHTAEGDAAGPTLAWRGLDNVASYRLEPGDWSRYQDYTGCGNTLDLRSPSILALVMDSLRYWVSEMHVDGFRFDLTPALARGEHGVEAAAPFLTAVGQDPVLRSVKLIAEPWDIGDGGYRVGRFPHPWSEWNGEYRDTVRDVWRPHAGGLRSLAYRLSGSADLYQAAGRAPYASVNFVTSHDGFTLRDLTTFEHKRNDANGEDGRDGESHNRGWNCGVEGEDAPVEVRALRLRQARNLLATLLLSTGVPMLSMGDEVRRTQLGNNNAYCQDGELSWMPWQWDDDDRAMLAFARAVLTLRRAHPALRQSAFFTGRDVTGDGRKDLAWFGAGGRELTPEQWHDESLATFGMFLSGHALRTRAADGTPLTDSSFLLLLHSGPDEVEVRLPGRPWADAYELVLDTTQLTPGPVEGRRLMLCGRSVTLLRAAPERRRRPRDQPTGHKLAAPKIG